jgi:hypothetical protein
MFTFIVGLTAFIIAGCAAYFSVQGLATLYSGAFLAVCIMAGSLEIGKLVAASYLHRYWERTSFLLKTYLIVSVLSLMGITSLGIFGFLTSAYQQSHLQMEVLYTKKSTLENEKQVSEKEIENLTKRIETLNQIRIIQEQRVQDAGNYKLPREQAYEAINKANVEITDSQNKINELALKIKITNDEIVVLKIEETKSKDIGTLKFVAQLFNTDVSIVVKWFTFIIVLVFDPLAVCLILAYNNIVFNKNKKQIIDKQEEQEKAVVSESKNQFKKIPTPERVKYQDK